MSPKAHESSAASGGWKRSGGGGRGAVCLQATLGQWDLQAPAEAQPLTHVSFSAKERPDGRRAPSGEEEELLSLNVSAPPSIGWRPRLAV